VAETVSECVLCDRTSAGSYSLTAGRGFARVHDNNGEEPSGELTATDPTGCVQVRVDPLSGRLTNVALTTRWRDKVGVAGMAEAVMYAVIKARLSYLDSRTNVPEDHPSPATGPLLEPDALAGLTPERQREAWHRVADLLESVNSEAATAIGRLQSTTADGTDSHPGHTGSDDRQNISVTLNPSGAMSGLTLNEKWLGSASTERVVEALREAFQAAYDSLDGAPGSGQPTAMPATDRTIALTSDPARLARWLRQEED
jgi:hypothetical protein